MAERTALGQDARDLMTMVEAYMADGVDVHTLIGCLGEDVAPLSSGERMGDLIGGVREVRPATGGGCTWRLDELQGLVGGYVQIVPVEILHHYGWCLVVDEDGRQRGRQPNLLASALAGQHIVGRAVLTTRAALGD